MQSLGVSIINPFAKWRELQTCYWQEWSKWVSKTIRWSISFGSLVLMKVLMQDRTPRGFSLSPDRTCQPFLGKNVGVTWGSRWDASFMYLGELLSKPRRGWMITRETDSWLNWKLHVGTKHFNKSLGFWATYFPWKVCIFFQQNFVGGSYWVINWWICGT